MTNLKKSEKQPPAFEAGHQRGDLTVIACAGRHAANPSKSEQIINADGLSTRWWYVVQCACGRQETVSQKALNPSSTRTACLQCTRARKNETLSAKARGEYQRPQRPVSDIPDFARMKLR
jgi:hypothetical protein